MKRRWFDQLGSTAGDLLLLATGILFFTREYTGWTVLYILTVIYNFWSSIMLASSLYHKDKTSDKLDYLTIAFNVGFAVYLLLRPQDFLHWVHIFYGWWMLIHGLIYFLTFQVRRTDHLPHAAGMLFASIFSILLAVFMLWSPDFLSKNNLLSIFAGIYFIIYGLYGLSLRLSYTSKKTRRKFSFALPVLFTFLLPLTAYISVHKLIRESRKKPSEPEEDTDLHVYVYLKGAGPEMLGHLDLAYKGTIWSYGCHDPEHRRLFGTLGDGVLFQADEKAFIQTHLHVEHKTILCYGIRLNDSQREMIEKRIASLMERTVPWQSKAERCEVQGIPFEGFHDYASRVYKHTHCHMYKFTKGIFKTYFVTYTNCVMLADYLIRCDDLNLIDLSGIVTPGSYLSFLNTEYLKPDSIVVSRTLYETGIHEAD